MYTGYVDKDGSTPYPKLACHLFMVWLHVIFKGNEHNLSLKPQVRCRSPNLLSFPFGDGGHQHHGLIVKKRHDGLNFFQHCLQVHLDCYRGNPTDEPFGSGCTNLIWSLAINSADSLTEKIWEDVAINLLMVMLLYLFITLNLHEKQKKPFKI